MASNTQAKFSVALDDGVSAPAKGAASAMEELRARVEGGDTAIKEMSGALRRLRGSTDEVKAAKSALSAKIGAERDAVSAANLQLIKQGTTYDHLTSKTKKLAAQKEELRKKHEAAELAKTTAATKSYGNALSAVGGPAGGLVQKLGALKETLGGAEGGMSLAALGAVALAAAVIAVTVAAVAGVISLAKWIVTAANAARTANLFREAAAGGAQNAINLGTQVDALADKIPTSKAALNEMAISMAKGGIQGQTLVDTLNAVGQASAALGDDAGAKLKEFVDRGRLTKRFLVSPQELQGTGLAFDDLASEIAKSMHVGIKDARAALFEGRVKLGDGAAAMRAAVEKKFGKINLARMMDLDVLAAKLKEKLASLTSGVNLEPFLRGLQKLVGLFDESSFTGAALKTIITAFGNTLSTTFEASVPLISQFIKGMVIAGLDLAIAFYKIKNSITKTFGDSSVFGKIDGMTLALQAGESAVYLIAASFVLLGAAVALAVAPFVLLYGALKAIGKPFEMMTESFIKTDWAGIGKSIIDGLVNGLKFGSKYLTDTVSGLADSVKSGFKDALGIHSPSTVFADYGRYTTAGYAQGVDDGSPEANEAIASMVSVPSGGGQASRASGSAAPISVKVEINVDARGAKDGEGIAQAISAAKDEWMEDLVRQIAAQGVPT